jgi:uncharacterized small protein (TIGR04563 family)
LGNAKRKKDTQMAIGENFGGSQNSLTANGKRRGRPPGSGKKSGMGLGIGASGFNTETTPDHRKASIYLAGDLRQEIEQHAARLDRSVSWLLAHAWKLSREKISEMTSLDGSDDE